jgi:hypothetical protein
MAFAFQDLQNEVARRAVLNQSGSNYTVAIQNAINLSVWRIARDAKWRTLRRRASFNTVTTYFNGVTSALTINAMNAYNYANSTVAWPTGQGPASCATNSNVFSVAGATFISDGIQVGRWIKFDGSVYYFKIASITSETTGTLNQVYDGPTSTGLGYAIMPQEEYTLPIQIGHSCFLWHRKYGMPKIMQYVPAFEFYKAGVLDILTNIPVSYRMWGVDAAIRQPISASTLTYVSSSSSDNPITVTVFGKVNGFPDYETVTVTGTTPVTGTKSFSSVERIVKNQATIGLITVTSNPSANTYVFNVSGITTPPVVGNTYTNNGITYTITYVYVVGQPGSMIGTFTMTGSNTPTTSGTLTVATGSGDSTISFSSYSQQSVTVGVLPVGMTTTGPQYTKIQVYPLPNWIFPIYVEYYKLPYQLVNATDVPELGEDFSEAIILLAVAKLKAEQNLANDSMNFMQMFEKEIMSLKQTNLDKIDWKMVLKNPGEDGQYDQYTGGLRFSQIGGSGQYGGSWNP